MAKPLIIVESPTKAKTIKKFLPARYVVKASVGHVRDLPKSSLGVDVLHDFVPRYLTIKGKGDIIRDLKAAAKAASEVYLATDPDREGEAIAWHLAELLKLDHPMRVELHEITKEAALAALRDPHPIDMPRVNAQQARRILDRLVGYKISPLLWAKVRGGLSAGRVQSVAVRLIVDREREIRAFVPREYWSITAQLAALTPDPIVFAAELVQIDGEKAEIVNGDQAAAVMAGLEGARFRVASVKKRETRRNAAAPFTTSTLQQEASRKLKFRVRKTMQVAQTLYEGVDLGGSDGTQGLITYMRTDSTRIADSARDAARDYIVGRFGEAYYGGGRSFRVKAGAQDAHEAIRPTSALRTPESLAKVLKRDELRLYQLIYERFIASQMAAAVYDQTTVDIAAAERAIDRAIARPLGLTVPEAAARIAEIVNANMAEALRIVSIERGHDARAFSLIAFGGAGPVHAAALAEELQIPEVIVPPVPGAFSALGLVASDLKRDYVRTLYADLGSVDPARVTAVLAAMEASGTAMLDVAQVPPRRRALARQADLRYRRQAYELTVPVAEGEITRASLDAAMASFHAKHELTYGHANRNEPVQLVNLRLTAIGRLPTLVLAQRGDASEARTLSRDIWFSGVGFTPTPVHWRSGLAAGAVMTGPAVIEAVDSTTVVPPGWTARVDDVGFIRLTRS